MFFKTSKHSLFASLGDLSKYTLEQLKEKTSFQYDVSVENKDDIIIATFTDPSITLVVHYTNDSIFKKIHSETWESPKLHIERR
jgi:hypothetical protein